LRRGTAAAAGWHGVCNAGCADPEPLLIMADPTSPATAFIDAAGEACGTLTPVIRKSLAPLHAGEVLEVLAHDPAAREGVPAWCRLTGHELVDSRDDDAQRTRFWIRKKAAPSQPT